MDEIIELRLPSIRCITCGKVTGHVEIDYLEKLARDGADVSRYLTEKGFPPSRYCCRRTIMTPVRGLYLDMRGEIIEKAVYNTETFEEIQEETDEETIDISKNTTNLFERKQKNFIKQKEPVEKEETKTSFSRGRNRKRLNQASILRNLNTQSESTPKRSIPGKGKKRI